MSRDGNGYDRVTPEKLFAGIIEPLDLPENLTRGHLAMVMGQMVAMRMCVTLLVLQKLTERQRDSLRAGIDRIIELTTFAVRERKIRGQDRESVVYAEGCLEGLKYLRSHLIH